jgi:hypothetical protein
LAQHATKHDGWHDAVDASLKNGRGPMDRFVQKKISPAAWNIYYWLEWIIMDDLPFDFVERELTAANTKLLPICSKTFIKYMELTHEAIEAKVFPIPGMERRIINYINEPSRRATYSIFIEDNFSVLILYHIL